MARSCPQRPERGVANTARSPGETSQISALTLPNGGISYIILAVREEGIFGRPLTPIAPLFARAARPGSARDARYDRSAALRLYGLLRARGAAAFRAARERPDQS